MFFRVCVLNYVTVESVMEGEEDTLNTESEDTLDIQTESLVGDGFVGDWNVDNLLGSIPSDTLIGPPIDIGPPYLLPPPPIELLSKIDGESGAFQIEGPVSEPELIGSHSARESLPNRVNIAMPAQTRSKPVKSPRQSQRLLSDRTSMETVNDSLQVSDNVEQQNPSKKCTHCHITETAQWREGPNGPSTLCNACGIKYRAGRLLPEYRPAASPTFVPSLHSNSHKKVMEMRNQARHRANQN